MAYFSPLDDGSYSVELENGKRLRTAVDPVEYGYELRSPEEVASYAPQPLTNQERLDIAASNLDKMRRENDPDYRAFAEEQDRLREAERAREFYENEGRDLETDKASRTVALAFDDLDSVGQKKGELPAYATAPDTSPRQVSDVSNRSGMPSRAELDAAEGRTSTSGGGRVQVVVPERETGSTNRTGAPVPSPSGAQGRDPVKGALSDYAARNLFKRTGPSKGGFVPTTVTTQREGVPSPGALANVEQKARETDATGDAAIAARADALRKNVIQPSIQAVESDLNSLRASYQQRKAVDEEQARLKKYAEDTEKKAADMPRVNARQDYWADKGAFARVLYALSAGAFQFGQMLAGGSGPNLPIEMTEAAIADNAEKLRAEHEDAAAAGKTARNAYSEHLATFGDRESAMKALRLEGQAITDRMKGLRIAQHGSLEEQAAWEVEKAQRAEQRAREYADISAKAAGSTVSSERYVPPSSGGTSFDPKMADFYLKLNPDAAAGEGSGVQLQQRKDENERRVWLPPQLQQKLGLKSRDAWAPDHEAARAARDSMNYAMKGLKALDELEAVYGTPAHELNPDLKVRIESNAGVVQQIVGKNGLGVGQQTEGEFENITNALRGDQGMKWLATDGQALESIRKARSILLDEVEHHTRGLTASPWQQDYIAPDVRP